MSSEEGYSIQVFKKAAERVLGNFSPAILAYLLHFGTVTPEFGLLAQSALSIIGYYGDYSKDKTMDLFEEFEKNKDKISNEIITQDKFKAAFIKIVGDNITEGNEEKRGYIKNYILNFAIGNQPEFNEHTRLIATLNIVTLEEVEMLSLWDKKGIITEQLEKMSGRIGSLSINEIGQIVWEVTPRDNPLRLRFGRENQENNNQLLLSLGYKGLLYVLPKDNFGSGEEARVKDITKFGKIFLSFIKN